jgi:hypothetical protein
MPYIKVMNLSKEQMVMVAKNRLSDIAKISGAPENKFHFIHCSDFAFASEEAAFVYIEITWYARNAAQMQSVAKLLYDEIGKHGNYDVHVVFQDLPSPDNHYANGEPYKRPQS